MAPLCRESGISGVTGYKFCNRYKEVGLDALSDCSLAPYRQANRLPFQVERTIRIMRSGHICIGKRKSKLSTVFARQTAGIREIEDQVWLTSFMDYDLGFFNKEQGRVEPASNPFAPEKVLTM